ARRAPAQRAGRRRLLRGPVSRCARRPTGRHLPLAGLPARAGAGRPVARARPGPRGPAVVPAPPRRPPAGRSAPRETGGVAGRVHPSSGAGGTVWQTNRALTELGHEVELLTEADIRRRIGHHNVHYAFELPYRVLEAVRGRLARGASDVLLVSQPYGYRLGQW